MVNWSAQTRRTSPFNCNNTTQDKANSYKAPIDESKCVQIRWYVLMVSKARKARINGG